MAINDPAFVKIQRAEYVQYFKETLGQIALVSGLFLQGEVYKATGGETVVTFALGSSQPLKVEHLTRGGLVGREYSDNAMRNADASSLGRGFMTNNTTLDHRAYSVRLTPSVDNTIEIFFHKPLVLDEEINVTFSTSIDENSLPQAFNDVEFIPIYAFDCLYHGVLSKVMQKLMIADAREYNNSWQTAEMLYSRKMKDLIAYVRNLKSRAGVATVQPLLWLSDNSGEIPKGGNGIPPNYTTNIIDWP